MHLSGRPLAKPYRTRAFFLRIFLPACKKLVVLGHFSFQFELRFFLIWSWSIPVGASKIRCSTRAFAVSKAAVTDHSRHGNAKCEQDSKSGSRASGSWVRIPPYPPARACNQADYRLFSFFRNGQFRALALFRRENHPFSPTSIDPRRLVKSSRQTASAAPCQGTAQQFVSLLCGETAEAHHGKCANENLPKSKYGSLLKGCRKQENRKLMIQPTIIFR